MGLGALISEETNKIERLLCNECDTFDEKQQTVPTSDYQLKSSALSV